MFWNRFGKSFHNLSFCNRHGYGYRRPGHRVRCSPLPVVSPHLTVGNDAIASQQNEGQEQGFRI